MSLWAILRILPALAVYLLVALLSIIATRRLGANLEDMEARASGVVPLVGTVANLIVLGLVLLLLTQLCRRPVAALGWRFDSRDLLFLLVAGAMTVVLALGYIDGLRRFERSNRRIRSMALSGAAARQLVLAAILLSAVAWQEETLFRGYVGINLYPMRPLLVLLVTSVIFTAIHFPTNVASFWQTTSWFVGGVLLSAAYLVSGSIWIAIGIHFVTDFLNVLMFNIAGRGSLFEFDPPLQAIHRSLFRVAQTVVTVCALFLFYGTGLKAIG